MAASAALAACEPPGATDQLDVSVIGGAPRLGGDSAPSAVFSRAVAQGLVRFDEAGLVTPGLAERWIVLDGGRTIIFRLADARWADGDQVTAADVRAQLRRRLARPGSDPTIRAIADAVDEINAVIPAILEIRLKAERPDLLALMAQPAFVLTNDGGSGPWRAGQSAQGWRTLTRAANGDAPDPDVDARPSATVRLRGEAAATALARYAEGRVDVVLGGGWGWWPLARTAAFGSGDALMVDPAEGLFGLRVAKREGLLGDVEGRRALAMALNRDGLAELLGLGNGWARSTLVPGIPTPIWDEGPATDRIARARAIVDGWRKDHDGRTPIVTLATPDRPGWRLLSAWLTRQWAAIGVDVRRAGEAEAQLTILDRVAPSPDPASTLALVGCGTGTPCDQSARDAMTALGEQTTLGGWRAARAAAYRALADDLPVIPLGRPLRWSVVRAGVPGAVANARAVHPLTRMAPAASPDAP